jgi:TatD DNase family protein
MIEKIIDVHTHVNFATYNEDRDEVIRRAHEKCIGFINVGTQKDTSASAVELANKFDKGVYATVGLHPVHAGGSTYHDKKELRDEEYSAQDATWDYSFYKDLSKNKKVVAIGECGLDFFRLDGDSKKLQKKIFIEQIHLANEIELPLMLHIRNAYSDVLEILKSEAKVLGNVHFFAGNWEEAKEFLNIGFTLSFTGVITFTNDYDEIIKKVPLDMLHVETDAPYVAPALYRGKRNEPSYIIETMKKIAEIRGDDFDTMKKTLFSNSRRMFSL